MESEAFPERTTLATFAPLAAASRSGAVARQLSDAINLGLIADGDQLPAEAELAAHLGVATVTLRQALATLRRDGLIETRRGRGGGSFVRAPRGSSLRRARERLLATSADDLRDLADYRRAVSGASAANAAERASRFELTRLAQQLSDAAGTETLAGYRRVDSRFHIELAAIGHSARLTRAEISVQAEIGDMLLLVLDDDAERERSVDQHRAIIDAVRARDAEQARRLAEQHVGEDAARLIELHVELAARGGG